MSAPLFASALARRAAGAACLIDAAAPAGTVAVSSADPALIWLAACAASALGRPLMPLDPTLPEPLVTRLLAEAGATLWFGAAPRADLPCCDPAALLAQPDAAPPPSRLAPDDIAVLIATSGSSGQPKAVMLSAGALAASAAASQAKSPLGPGDRWLACLPLFHIGGFAIPLRCAAAGAEAVLHTGFDAAAVWRALAEDGITHLSLVPAMLAALLDVAPGPPPARLRHVLVGGAALTAELAERGRRAGWPLQPTYGMSETASQIATLASLPAAWQSGHVGHPLPGVEIALTAEGRLKLRGPMLMAGYATPAHQRGEGLTEGWFITNDLARITDTGELVVLGRADDVIISGGKKVHPALVEDAVARCPGITAASAAGRPDPVWGEIVTLIYSGPATATDVLAWCRAHVPGPLRPRAAVQVDALPRLPNGKPDRQALRALAGVGEGMGGSSPTR